MGRAARYKFFWELFPPLGVRLASRRAHFFPPALLDSQLATLEEPADALVIDATLPVDEIVARITSE